jgi:DNA-binding response OmpR family regulator
VINTILVVDDEHDLAVTCERLLRRLGWVVVTATTRAEALAALRVPPAPKLAIVDRQLSDGDGLDVLAAARAAGTPVIMTTGRDSSETRRLTLEAGAAGFLAKPFSAHDLLALVRTVAGDPSSTGAVPPLGSASPTRRSRACSAE